MNRTLFAINLLVFLGLLEWYTYRAIRREWANWSLKWRRPLRIFYFSLSGLAALSLVALFGLHSLFPSALLNFWFSFLLLNSLTKLVFAFFLAVDDLRRAGLSIRRRWSGEPTGTPIGRADFLVKVGLAAAAVPMTCLTWGMIAGPYRYRLVYEKVRIPQLPSAFRGLRIAQISDIHAGSFYDKEAVQRGVDLLLAQQADVIFFTGDLVNNKAEEMKPYVDVFSKLEAPMGTYSVLGNHDYGDYIKWESVAAYEENQRSIRELHQLMGWKLLRNEHVYLEREGQRLGVIGVENWGKGFHQNGDLAKAYRGIDAPVKLLLSHDPTHFDEVVAKHFEAIDITFSGHTHGAQMGVEVLGWKWSPVSLRYKKWAGLYRENNQYLYVNRGFGFIGYAGRIGIMPEITIVELTS